mmetsp:Transcript_12164/g.25522  ORF Transcript_12164/g.25522 Transcript_12164/m.25522 type:complete len:227 (-) Transcript_12164:808-1488(-)
MVNCALRVSRLSRSTPSSSLFFLSPYFLADKAPYTSTLSAKSLRSATEFWWLFRPSSRARERCRRRLMSSTCNNRLAEGGSDCRPSSDLAFFPEFVKLPHIVVHPTGFSTVDSEQVDDRRGCGLVWLPDAAELETEPMYVWSCAARPEWLLELIEVRETPETLWWASNRDALGYVHRANSFALWIATTTLVSPPTDSTCFKISMTYSGVWTNSKGIPTHFTRTSSF